MRTKTKKKLTWNVVSYGTGASAVFISRRLLMSIWSHVRSDPPPDGTTAVRAPMVDALIWAVATGAGVGVARLMALRSAARVWEAAVHEPPPGVES